MEGLLLAEALGPLRERLPRERGAWRFPDERTAVLLLGQDGPGAALWVFSRPPSPRLALRLETPASAPPRTPFQEQLAARATGPLTGVQQQGLDRVVELSFGASNGFVPQPPVTLVVELTGRNANLVLIDQSRAILGVERVVLNDRNRYRELRPGVPYRPPPPYHKVDPRALPPDELRSALQGLRLKDVRGVLDGIGPELTRALASGCGLTGSVRLDGDALDKVVAAVPALAADPTAWLAAAGVEAGLEERRRRDNHERAAAVVRAAHRRRLELAERRLGDLGRAAERVEEARQARLEADLLMAYAATVPEGAERVTLDDFEGTQRELVLDPTLDAFGNARKRYDRARRLQERAARGERERPRLEAEHHAAATELAGIETMAEEELQRRARDMAEERRRRGRPAGPGVRFHDPRGFEVVVGRNARENDAVTFSVARSRDVWLHVQGYTGSHVVVRADGREVPFDTVLFAARLAAGFSSARQSDNVPVDYTLRKNVWKVKGQPPGTVHFSHQKTVYVTPARDPGGAEG